MVPPFLVRVLSSRVPRCHRYYGTLRLPAPITQSLMDSLLGSCDCFIFALAGLKLIPASPVLFNQRTNGHFTQVSTGSRRFLRNPSRTFAPVTDSGRTDIVSPNRHFSADPTSCTMKSPALGDFEAQSRGFSTCCLRFTARVTPDYAKLTSS